MTANLFFTGLLLRWDDIPKYWRWLAYINFMRYSWGALMLNQFEGNRDVQVSKTVKTVASVLQCGFVHIQPAPHLACLFLHVCALLMPEELYTPLPQMRSTCGQPYDGCHMGFSAPVQLLGGATVLQYYSLSGADKWVWLGIEFSFFLVFFFLAFLALSFVSHVKR